MDNHYWIFGKWNEHLNQFEPLSGPAIPGILSLGRHINTEDRAGHIHAYEDPIKAKRIHIYADALTALVCACYAYVCLLKPGDVIVEDNYDGTYQFYYTNECTVLAAADVTRLVYDYAAWVHAQGRGTGYIAPIRSEENYTPNFNGMIRYASMDAIDRGVAEEQLVQELHRRLYEALGVNQ